MFPKFKVGDVVKVKSGGLEMTVNSVVSRNSVTGEEIPFDGRIECYNGITNSYKILNQELLEFVRH